MQNKNDVIKKCVMLSLTQHLQRLPLQLVSSVRERYPAGRPPKYGMMSLCNNGGFVLPVLKQKIGRMIRMSRMDSLQTA